MFMHNYAQFPYILFPTQMTCAVAYDMIIDQLPVFIHKYAQFPYIFSPTLMTCAVAYDVIVDRSSGFFLQHQHLSLSAPFFFTTVWRPLQVEISAHGGGLTLQQTQGSSIHMPESKRLCTTIANKVVWHCIVQSSGAMCVMYKSLRAGKSNYVKRLC